MNAPGTPRFRFRAPDGSEVPVGSVEDLSTRLEAGELGPDTPLFDAGTGSWARAGDVPVFQFVLEELRAEGRLPEEEEVVVLPDPPPEDLIDPGADFEIRHKADSPKPLAAPTVDPFELHLPLSNPLDPREGRDPLRAKKGETVPEHEIDAAPDSTEGDGSDPKKAAEPDPPSEPWFEDRPFTEADAEPRPRTGGEDDAGSGPADAAVAADDDTDADVSPDATPRKGRGVPDAKVPTREGLPSGEGRPEARAAADAPLDPDIDPSPLHAWLTHGPPAPGGAPPSENRETGVRKRPSETSGPRQPAGTPVDPGVEGVESAPPFARSAAARDEVQEQDRAPIEIRTAWEGEAEAEDPRAARLAARRRRRNARVLAGMVAGTIVLVGGAAIFTSTRSTVVPAALDPIPGPVPGDVATDPAPGPEGFALPSGLEGAATVLWRDLPGQVAAVVDSLRVEAGLSDVPPRDWLGGYYLANAGEFPEVVEFWEAYRSFVGRLADRDSELARTAALRAIDAGDRPEMEGLSAADRQRLVEYVERRHVGMVPARTDRFLHLQRTAEAALGLHDFLVRNGGSITHSPALGRGVSADPVLEAVTETPAVRREMEGHLDRIFEALDRTRGGGQPSLVGLRSELFGSLGRPL